MDGKTQYGMGSDPFNFDSFRASAPGFEQKPDSMSLEDVRQLVDEIRSPPPPEQDAPADISMPDAEVSDDDLQDEEGIPENTDTKASPVQTPQLEETDEASRSGPSSQTPTRWLHPSQMGAQLAVAPLQKAPEMPIFVPWHQSMPYILSTFLQLLFNVAVILIAGCLIFLFRKDVSFEVRERSSAIANEAAACADQYIINECRLGLRRPELSKFCEELERCMERDPMAVRRLSAGAATLATIFNEFLDPLSIRTMCLLVGMFVVTAFAGNYGFGFLRARTFLPTRRESNSREHPSSTALTGKHSPDMK